MHMFSIKDLGCLFLRQRSQEGARKRDELRTVIVRKSKLFDGGGAFQYCESSSAHLITSLPWPC